MERRENRKEIAIAIWDFRDLRWMIETRLHTLIQKHKKPSIASSSSLIIANANTHTHTRKKKRTIYTRIYTTHQ